MSFMMLAPEINSALMYSGAGSGPMLAAAGGWDGLAVELASAAESFGSVASGLAGSAWQGPSSAAMAAAATPYVGWLSGAAAQAAGAAAQARVTAAAFETALAATVHPGIVAANRSQLVSLVMSNLLGQNAPAIAAAEAEYEQQWAQDVSALVGYHAGASAAAANLTAWPESLPSLPSLADRLASAAVFPSIPGLNLSASADGVTLFQSGSATTSAVPGLSIAFAAGANSSATATGNNVAMAFGPNSSASATGGSLAFATAFGTDSVAVASSNQALGVPNAAIVFGNNSSAFAIGAHDNLAFVTGNNSSAFIVGDPTSSNNTAVVYGNNSAAGFFTPPPASRFVGTGSVLGNTFVGNNNGAFVFGNNSGAIGENGNFNTATVVGNNSFADVGPGSDNNAMVSYAINSGADAGGGNGNIAAVWGGTNNFADAFFGDHNIAEVLGIYGNNFVADATNGGMTSIVPNAPGAFGLGQAFADAQAFGTGLPFGAGQAFASGEAFATGLPFAAEQALVSSLPFGGSLPFG